MPDFTQDLCDVTDPGAECVGTALAGQDACLIHESGPQRASWRSAASRWSRMGPASSASPIFDLHLKWSCVTEMCIQDW